MAKRGVFEDLVPKGENPNGVTQVTPNGVTHFDGEGYNQDSNYWPTTDGDRWNKGISPSMSPWSGEREQPQRRRNRTGE